MATVNQVVDRGFEVGPDGLLVGRYRPIRKLAGGSSGDVYLVEEAGTGARRAFKLIAEGLAAFAVRGEFEQLTALDHPNVVRVVGAGTINRGDLAGRAYLVTDFVTGPSLTEMLATLPASRRFAVFATAAEGVADALAYLHGKGILHGDISPANVRCDEQGRSMLIDFGLACGVDVTSRAVSGTLGFMAPEALLGERGPSTDLFALGATLYDAWTGTPPFGVGMESVRTMWQGAPAPPSSLFPGLPDTWDRLLLQLLAATPEARPATAREVLRTIRLASPEADRPLESALAAPHPAGDPLAGAVVGRGAEQARLRSLLSQLAEGVCPASVVCVVGGTGSGRHTLIRRVLRDARLAVLAQSWGRLDIEETSAVELLRTSETVAIRSVDGADLDPASGVQEDYATLARTLEVKSEQCPLCIALAGSAEDEALAAAVAASEAPGRLLVFLPCERPIDRPGILSIESGPLSRADIAELAARGAGQEPPAAVIDEILAASNGLAGAVALLVRRWIARQRGSLSSVGPLISGESWDFARLLDATFASLASETRAALVRVALAPEASDVSTAWRAEPMAEAERAGWLAAKKPGPWNAPHLQALWRAVAASPELRPLARTAADALAEDDPRRAEVDFALGERNRAALGFLRAMQRAAVTTTWSGAAALGMRALDADAKAFATSDRLTLATALGTLGRYDEALAILDGCSVAEKGRPIDLVERRAWLLGRQGNLSAARATLHAALADFPAHERAGLLRARLARVLVSSGAFAEALATIEPVRARQDDAGALARETGVLALAYQGRLPAARVLLDEVKARATAASEPLLLARASALSGLVEQLDGRPARAAAAYEDAVKRYEKAHDLHGFAAASFNLGCTLAEIGNYSGALQSLELASRELGRLNVRSDHALAVFNLGQLFLHLGDAEAAAHATALLARDARSLKMPLFNAYAALLSAQVARRKDPAQAARQYEEARSDFASAGMTLMADIATMERAEALAELQPQKAWELLVQQAPAPAVAGQDGEATSPAAELWAAARARVSLRGSATTAEFATSLAVALAEHAARAKSVERLPVAWRLSALAGQLFARLGDSRAAANLDVARAIFSEIKMKTPAKYWPGMESDSEARILQPSVPEGRGSDARVERAVLLENHLRRLLRINKRLNSDLRLSRVLETIIDTVIELTDAERGFLLLRDGTGELTVKVARNMDQTSLEGPSSSLSRSIAKRAADTGEPVIAVDAAGDSRFAEHMSVSDLHLRSVLAVPLTVKGNVVGTIYVDHRLRKGVFGDDELAMVLDFAEQGAIAIENARVISELRRREQQIQALNRRLERELKAQEEALSDARIELKESRQVAALRYDYRQIVGQSPCMVELFRLLDRVTDTMLPVVIEGESGTGKELVARAIHFNGPRKDRPFVSENCAAIPETLLESALFGHVRGSFTGADRDTRGLFSIANGGTLFLDEVGEMSAAMQGKLLRVLQDGQFHRVGAERPEKADVRVVVATNRNLADMVEAGKFRKDLFYRLSVVRLHLPPLRERREDIPLLVRHFLQKAAEQGAAAIKSVEPAALAKLSRYHWPGNVRELENEIARAGAFASSAITVNDLSPHIPAGQDPNETLRNEPDGLRLRHRVERLERQLLREALNRSQGNQTKAAALLGLSRFGLQKKLRRYSLEA